MATPRPKAARELRPVEVAARLGIGMATLYRRIDAGTAPPSYTRGNRRLFPEDRFEAWLAKQQQAAS